MGGKASATIVVRSVSERAADLKTAIVSFRRRILAGQPTKVGLHEDSKESHPYF